MPLKVTIVNGISLIPFLKYSTTLLYLMPKGPVSIKSWGKHIQPSKMVGGPQVGTESFGW